MAIWISLFQQKSSSISCGIVIHMEQIESTQTTPVAEGYQPLEADQNHTKKKGFSMKGVGVVGVFLVVVLAGVGTGFGLSKLIPSTRSGSGSDLMGAPGTISADKIAVGKTYGANDGKKFPDFSEGVITKGGMDGEGSHHLVRPGGSSQTVYLTSSVVDLDLFVGHKVQVKGETFSAQKAAWFMDVGSVTVMQLNAAVPESARTSFTN